MTDAERELTALQQLRGAVLRMLAEENSPGFAARAGRRAPDDEVKLAARNLTRAVDAREPGRQPNGWREPVVLLSPECRGGQHRECDGAPCEDACHTEDVPGVAA
jgi:hypothetical protein